MVEKKLYTRLEICNTLEKGNIETAKAMINYVGKIGSNQYKTLPDRPSNKISYPLPRDIVSRSLGRMDVVILPVLVNVLEGGDITKIQEVIDAIGFLVFYNPSVAKLEYLDKLIDIMRVYRSNDIILWKCITCLSAFPYEKAQNILLCISKDSTIDLFSKEANRSLKLINQKVL